ncbi:MAG: vitamin K epoxide reductase family protein [Crocinitomicaceae bacterium]
MEKLQLLLEKNFSLCNISFNKERLQTILQSDTSENAYEVITNTLQAYHVEQLIVQLEHPSQLDEFPLPCFAAISTKQKGSTFVLLENIIDGDAIYYDGEMQRLSKKDFVESIESGILVLQEPGPESGELTGSSDDKSDKTSRIRRLLFNLTSSCIVVLLFFLSLYKSSLDGNLIFLTISSFLGFVVSILIYKVQFERAHWAQKICGSGQKNGCNSLLSGEYSRLFGISLSDIGFLYFTFSVLFLIFPFISVYEKTLLFTYVSIPALLFIPYSLFVQYFKVKSWCRLCLLIQLSLFLGGIWSLLYGTFDIRLSESGITAIMSVFLVSIIISGLYKLHLEQKRTIEFHNVRLLSILRKREVYELLNDHSALIPEDWTDPAVCIRNETGTDVFIEITSPYCTHCQDAYQTLRKLMHKSDDFSVFFIFNVSQSPNAKKLTLLCYALGLFQEGENEKAMNVLDVLYSDHKSTLTKLFVNEKALAGFDEHVKTGEERLAIMKDWCKKHQLLHKPIIYRNGKRLPAFYDLSLFNLIH